MSLKGKRILVTGGTGSLGQTLVRRLLASTEEKPARLTVFSRDEAQLIVRRLLRDELPQVAAEWVRFVRSTSGT